uniref:Uncharacterized protein n=1 Tax=Setaria italica TaxID=4555 RepID=K4AHU0_SETIT
MIQVRLLEHLAIFLKIRFTSKEIYSMLHILQHVSTHIIICFCDLLEVTTYTAECAKKIIF